MRAGRDAGQAASGRKRSGQTKIKMQEGHPIHAQYPIPLTLSKHPMENPWVQTSKKIQWLFWNEMVFFGGGGGGQGVCLQQVTSQKLLVESKGIFQTRSDLSFLSTDKIELQIRMRPQKPIQPMVFGSN